MTEEKSGEESGKALLKKDTSQKIDYLLSKRIIKEKDIYYLLKDFLREYTGVNYHFTHQEIIDELKNVYVPAGIRKDFFDLIDDVFVFEYVKKDYSDRELRSFLDRFKKYLNELIVIHNKEKTFSDKLRELVENTFLPGKRKPANKKSAVKEEEKEPVSPEDNLPAVEEVDEFHIKFNIFLEQMYYSLDNDDLETAKNHYYELMNLYNTLLPEEKQLYYEQLNLAYKDLSSSF